MVFNRTKVVIFAALFCWVAATVDVNSGAFQKKVEKYGMGPEGTEELMANIQSKVVKGGPKGEEELVISNPIHYRTKRSGPLSWSKYIFDMSIKKYTKEK